MTPLIPRLFPDLADKSWAFVDLNEEALARTPADRFPQNPLLDAAHFEAFLQAIARDRGVDFTYGGYLEWRGHVLRGTYMQPDAMRHLGVDYNAPEGTSVALPVEATLVEIARDPDQDGGWGGRLIFRRPASGVHLVLAHLAHASLPDASMIDATFPQGAPVAAIGGPGENGNWFAHLHVQCIAPDEFAHARDSFDGYAATSADLNARYPSPDDALA